MYVCMYRPICVRWHWLVIVCRLNSDMATYVRPKIELSEGSNHLTFSLDINHGPLNVTILYTYTFNFNGFMAAYYYDRN